MDTNLIIPHCTLVIKLFKSQSSFKLTSQSSFKLRNPHMGCPLLKLISVLLVMYKWLNTLYHEINGKYSYSLAVTNDVLCY